MANKTLTKYTNPTTLQQIAFNTMLDHNHKPTTKKYINYNEAFNAIISNPKHLASARHIIKENKLNQAYGKETTHPSESPRQPIKTEYLMFNLLDQLRDQTQIEEGE